MAITMQGSWTVRVSGLSAAFKQRLVVSGASSGNGTYNGTVGTMVFVTGPQWSVNVQSSPDNGATWNDSAHRITFPSVSAGVVSFNIRTNDLGTDQDFNDLTLTCSMTASSSEYIVYGTAKTYQGRCLFNPCRRDYFVLDPPYQIYDICRRFPKLCEPIRKLYPELIPKKPFPDPDPGPLARPIVLPTGAASSQAGIVFESKMSLREAEATIDEKEAKKIAPDARERKIAEALQTSARQVMLNAAPVSAGAELLTLAERRALAELIDIGPSLFRCDVDPGAGLLLRFQEYDRTASEMAGSPYTGTGDRQDLGLTVTDDLGNYIFRFSRNDVDVAQEFGDVASGEVLSTQLRPDVIAQVLGTGMTMTWETAPYYNIPNLKRIDLCIPHDKAHPNRACAGDRVIQRIGDVIVLHSALGGSPNTLDGAGRITCRNANAPQVDCAAWRGGLRVYACFGKPEALRYAIYFKTPAEALWHPVDENHKLNYIPDFSPTYTGTSVGATLAAVNPGVPTTLGPGAAVPTYANHDNDLNWIENDLKVILHTGNYRPADSPGTVQFRIEAYNAAGNVVAGTVDQITLYIHNQTQMVGRPQNSKGDIESITMGTTTLGDCALFELETPNAPLTVRHRAVDPAGFLANWNLSVTRGNNNPVSTQVTGGVVPQAYNTGGLDCFFTGTREMGDAQDYVETTLQPTGGASWLPEGQNFCAFAFTLTADDRITDGRTGHKQVVFWQDLIGLASDS